MNIEIQCEIEYCEDWEPLKSIELQEHPESNEAEQMKKNLDGYLCLYDYELKLPNGEVLVFSASFSEHNNFGWIMISENGKHKASVEAVKEKMGYAEPCLIYTTQKGLGLRLLLRG